MINFKDVVLSYLEEQTPTPTAKQPATKKPKQPQAAQGTLFWHYTNHEKGELKELARFLAESFSINKWPDATSLFVSVEEAYKRKVANILVNFDDYYPLMDFLWFVLQNNNKNYSEIIKPDSKFKIVGLKALANKFKDSCKALNPGKNLNPLFGYTPVSAQGKLLQQPLQKHISNSLVGKMSLQNFNNLSTRKALYGILEARKKVRSSALSNKNIPTAVDYIDNILKTPEQYAGQQQIPPQLRSLYDGVTGNILIEISQAFHEFFESEYYSATVSAPEQPVPKPSAELFMQFISNPSGNEDFAFPIANKEYPSTNVVAGSGGYTISNIKKINTPQAKAVISELEIFANYVSEGEPKDLVSKLQATASALKGVESALGIKM